MLRMIRNGKSNERNKKRMAKDEKNEGTVELVHTCMSLVHHVIQRFLLCIPSHFLVHAWIEQTDLWMFSRHVKNTNIEVNQNLITDKSFLFVVRNFWRYTGPGWLLEHQTWKFKLVCERSSCKACWALTLIWLDACSII